MALIRNFVKKVRDRYSVHQEIETNYSAFERDGKVFLQIDTSGRATREFPGKQSQTIQLDRTGGLALYKILKDEFELN